MIMQPKSAARLGCIKLRRMSTAGSHHPLREQAAKRTPEALPHRFGRGIAREAGFQLRAQADERLRFAKQCEHVVRQIVERIFREPVSRHRRRYGHIVLSFRRTYLQSLFQHVGLAGGDVVYLQERVAREYEPVAHKLILIRQAGNDGGFPRFGKQGVPAYTVPCLVATVEESAVIFQPGKPLRKVR